MIEPISCSIFGSTIESQHQHITLNAIASASDETERCKNEVVTNPPQRQSLAQYCGPRDHSLSNRSLALGYTSRLDDANELQVGYCILVIWTW